MTSALETEEMENLIDALTENLERSRSEAAKLREALAFYADRENWLARGHPQIDADTVPITADGGKIAREALGHG